MHVIRKETGNKERHLELLLLADPSKRMIEINKGIVVEGDLKPVIRVIIEDVLHLKVKEQ